MDFRHQQMTGKTVQQDRLLISVPYLMVAAVKTAYMMEPARHIALVIRVTCCMGQPRASPSTIANIITAAATRTVFTMGLAFQHVLAIQAMYNRIKHAPL